MSNITSYLTNYIIGCAFISHSPDSDFIKVNNLVIVNTFFKQINPKDSNQLISASESLDMQGVQILESSKLITGTSSHFRSIHMNSVLLNNNQDNWITILYGIIDIQQINFTNLASDKQCLFGSYNSPPGATMMYAAIVNNSCSSIFHPETRTSSNFFITSSIITDNTFGGDMMASNYNSVRCSDCYFFRNSRYSLTLISGDKYYFENCYSDKQFEGSCIEQQPNINNRSPPELPKFVSYGSGTCKNVKSKANLVLFGFNILLNK